MQEQLEQERRQFIIANIADKAVGEETDLGLRQLLFEAAYREVDKRFTEHPEEYEAVRQDRDRELSQLKTFRQGRIRL